MEALDLIDVSYVVDANTDPHAPKDHDACAFEGMKVLVDGELYVSKRGQCGTCVFAGRNATGDIDCMIPQKQFWCHGETHYFNLQSDHTDKVHNGSN